MKKALRVAFAGTPDFAACALDAIIEAGFEVPLVLTQPDRPAGRGMKHSISAVKKLALTHGLTIEQPETLKMSTQYAVLATCEADVLVVAAYGLILPRAVLDLPRLGCINIHASLLPRWRGAAPIHRAIEAGDKETGITIIQMDEGLDTGPMLLRQPLSVAARETTGSLHDRLAVLGAKSVVFVLNQLVSGELVACPQPKEGVSYAKKISRAESVINWEQPATEIERMIRAFDPFPGSITTLNDVTIKIWSAEITVGVGEPGEVLEISRDGIVVASGEGALCLQQLQRAGGRRLSAMEFLRGFEVSSGDKFI